MTTERIENSENTSLGFKSRRAHSLHLDTSEKLDFFDPIEFAQKFDKINPGIRIWDAVKGERA